MVLVAMRKIHEENDGRKTKAWRLAKAFKKTSETTSFSSWIFRIATNTITDHYRAKHFDTSIDDDESPLDPADHQQNLSKAADLNLLGIELEKVLEELSERERLAITMKYYAEASYEEMANVLKCSANNAGVILHRALLKCEKIANKKLSSFK